MDAEHAGREDVEASDGRARSAKPIGRGRSRPNVWVPQAAGLAARHTGCIMQTEALGPFVLEASCARGLFVKCGNHRLRVMGSGSRLKP